MANDIHNVLKSNQQPKKLEHEAVESASQQLPKRSQDAPDQPRQGDRVTLTNTVAKLRDLSRRLVAEPFVDTEGVERIKQQLVDGSYKIDAAQITDKLLAHERFLGSGRSQ